MPSSAATTTSPSSSSSSSSSITSITSLQLWASSKIIGRQCSTENKDYFLCKKDNWDPRGCIDKADKATACTESIVNTLNASFPNEFAAFQKCLDYNDYRISDCKKTERALLDCWNTKMGLKKSEE